MLRRRVKRLNTNECEIDGCSYPPTWEVKPVGLSPRLSCTHHLNDCIELGRNNLLVPHDAFERAMPMPFMVMQRTVALAAAA